VAQVFNFGSINVDYVYRVPHLVQPGETLSSDALETVLGGKGANQSVALARAGVAVTHIGRVGKSDGWATDMLAEFGVNTSSIESMDMPSGHAIIQVDAAGENAIVLHGGANQSFDANSIRSMLSKASQGDWLLLQNECNALDAAFSIAEELGLNIAFNPAPMNDAVASLPLAQCKVLILNEVEAAQLAGTNDQQALEQALQEKYPHLMIVLTLGSRGAKLLHGEHQFTAASPSVNVVDTTGAGDTFVGFLLAGIINNDAPEVSLQRACNAGSLAVTVAGATPSIPSLEQVEKLHV